MMQIIKKNFFLIMLVCNSCIFFIFSMIGLVASKAKRIINTILRIIQMHFAVAKSITWSAPLALEWNVGQVIRFSLDCSSKRINSGECCYGKHYCSKWSALECCRRNLLESFKAFSIAVFRVMKTKIKIPQQNYLTPPPTYVILWGHIILNLNLYS